MAYSEQSHQNRQVMVREPCMSSNAQRHSKPSHTSVAKTASAADTISAGPHTNLIELTNQTHQQWHLNHNHETHKHTYREEHAERMTYEPVEIKASGASPRGGSLARRWLRVGDAVDTIEDRKRRLWYHHRSAAAVNSAASKQAWHPSSRF